MHAPMKVKGSFLYSICMMVEKQIIEHTNPQTPHPQPNWIPYTTQPIITALKLHPLSPNTYP